MRRSIVTVLLVVTVAVSGCSPAPRWTDQEISDVALTWVYGVGLNQRDPDVWAKRLDQICEIGDAPGEAMVRMTDLAARFIEEDADVSIWSDGRLPEPAEAAQQLLMIAASPTCKK